MYLLKQIYWCKRKFLRKYVNINNFIKSIFQRSIFPVKFARILHFVQWRKLSSGGRGTTSDIARFNPFSVQTVNSILPLMTLSIFCSRLRYTLDRVSTFSWIFIRTNHEWNLRRCKAVHFEHFVKCSCTVSTINIKYILKYIMIDFIFHRMLFETVCRFSLYAYWSKNVSFIRDFW